jgi:hypothetical protein
LIDLLRNYYPFSDRFFWIHLFLYSAVVEEALAVVAVAVDDGDGDAEEEEHSSKDWAYSEGNDVDDHKVEEHTCCCCYEEDHQVAFSAEEEEQW